MDWLVLNIMTLQESIPHLVGASKKDAMRSRDEKLEQLAGTFRWHEQERLTIMDSLGACGFYILVCKWINDNHFMVMPASCDYSVEDICNYPSAVRLDTSEIEWMLVDNKTLILRQAQSDEIHVLSTSYCIRALKSHKIN